MSERPNCYKCKHRGSVSGSVHSSCCHPATGQARGDALASVFAIFASVGRTDPMIAGSPVVELGIKLNPHGVRMGWANWPWNFDPVWLEACNGFEELEDETKAG